MKFKLIIVIIAQLCAIISLRAREKNLLPKPISYIENKGAFRIGNISVNSDILADDVQVLVKELGGDIQDKANKSIEISIVDNIEGVPTGNNEAYKLLVSNNKISIKAITEQGAYWALQTLRQLAESGDKSIVCCEITDYPAFPIRGFMQDVGRSYVSIDELKREINVLSKFKINVFHWHLTENQAWRLESKIFPMLNDSVNTTRMPGKYYTLEEAKDLVDYCKKRHVLLIPEIDMPGHSAAFVRTFRHDMQSKEGMKILKLLMDEVCETFDVPYLHIGTDEVQFTNPDFVPEMVEYIRAKGKKLISWNPGWQYKPGEIDMTHLWSYRGKAQDGIPAIDSRFHYLNHFDTFADIIALYTSSIYGKQNGNDGTVAGSILALWHDRLVEPESNMILENNFYPNMLALAERAWIGGGSQYFDKTGTNMPAKDSQDYKDFADFERRMLWHRDHTFCGYPFGYVKQTGIEWAITDAFPNNGNLDMAFPPEEAMADKYLYEGKEYGVKTAEGTGIYLRHVWGKTIPTFYEDPQENHTAYVYTWVYSPKEQTVGLWAETQNYSRSEMDIPPLEGTWDYKGSKIWVNDNEIESPKWTANHTEKSNEIPLGNENFLARKPIPVTLHKGWNKVMLKLPIGKFSMPQTRLTKWMFAAVFVDMDTHKEIKDLEYSPLKIRK